MTADAPDGETNGQTESGAVERTRVGEARSANRPDGRDDTAEDATVPDETRRARHEAQRIGGEIRPVIERLMQACPEQAADETEADDLPGEIARLSLAREVVLHHQARRDEGKRHHHAERVDRHRAEVEEDGLHREANLLSRCLPSGNQTGTEMRVDSETIRSARLCSQSPRTRTRCPRYPALNSIRLPE